MPYVSARYIHAVDPVTYEVFEAIQATDAEGVDWAIPPDCQVGDWLRYVEEGGTIEPATGPRPLP